MYTTCKYAYGSRTGRAAARAQKLAVSAVRGAPIGDLRGREQVARQRRGTASALSANNRFDNNIRERCPAATSEKYTGTVLAEANPIEYRLIARKWALLSGVRQQYNIAVLCLGLYYFVLFFRLRVTRLRCCR